MRAVVLCEQSMPPLSNNLPKLTGKQQRWVDAYVGDARFNATEAARIAGYSSARHSGWLNRQNADVYAHVQAWLNANALGAEEVLAELRDVAVSEWRDHIEIKTDPKTGETIDVKLFLADKIKALELLGKHHKLFTDNVAVSGGIRREYVVTRPAEPSSPLTDVPDEERGDA